MQMGASGRLFSTQLDLDSPEFEAVYQRIRWARPLPIETYREEVRLAAERGWAMDDGYFSVGILAVAAPVYSPEGSIDFTVSAVMFRGQRDDEGIKELAGALTEFCSELADVLF